MVNSHFQNLFFCLATGHEGSVLADFAASQNLPHLAPPFMNSLDNLNRTGLAAQLRLFTSPYAYFNLDSTDGQLMFLKNASI